MYIAEQFYIDEEISSYKNPDPTYPEFYHWL